MAGPRPGSDVPDRPPAGPEHHHQTSARPANTTTGRGPTITGRAAPTWATARIQVASSAVGPWNSRAAPGPTRPPARPEPRPHRLRAAAAGPAARLAGRAASGRCPKTGRATG